MISKQTIDQIYQTAQIEDVIGDFVSLRKAGANLKGLSPFTNEKTPSFVVSPAKQIFKCFSSGKGGNIITFLKDQQGFDYVESLRYLARKYNIEIIETQQSAEEQAERSLRDSLFVINGFALDYFKKQLHDTDEGRTIALPYFVDRRKLTTDTISTFALGYCPRGGTAFSETAIAKGYDKKYLEDLGLTLLRGEHKVYDKLQNRIIFPIHNISGRIIGFAGRTLSTKKEIAKYINSPESLIYHKSRALYGIYQARQAINRQDECYLVEGYMDVIALHQHGITNAVASCGTALTRDQVSIIRRLTYTVTLFFDSDRAGQQATDRAIRIAVQEGMNVQVLPLPEGEDPDDFVRTRTASQRDEYISAHKQNFLTYLTHRLEESSKGDPFQITNGLKGICQILAYITDPNLLQLYINQLATHFKIDIGNLQTYLNNARELNAKLDRQKKLRISRTEAPKEKTNLEAVPKGESFEEQIIYSVQTELARLMVLYADCEIEIQWDENTEPKKTTVCEEVVEIINTYDIEPVSAIFDKIKNVSNELMEKDTLPTPDFFLKHEDTDIAHFAASSSLPPHKLDQWSAKDVDVIQKDTNLSEILHIELLRYKYWSLDHQRSLAYAQTKEEDFSITNPIHEKIVDDYMHLKAQLQQVSQHNYFYR